MWLEHHNNGARPRISGAWCMAFCQSEGTTVFFLSNHFPDCHVKKKKLDLIFVNDTLSWLIEWRHWPANRWHTVSWCHILARFKIAWTLSWVGTKQVPGTRTDPLMENLKHRVKPTRAGTCGKGLMKNFSSTVLLGFLQHLYLNKGFLRPICE